MANEMGWILIAAAARDLGDRGVGISEQACSQFQTQALAMGKRAAAQMLAAQGTEVTDRDPGGLRDLLVAERRREIGGEHRQRALQRRWAMIIRWRDARQHPTKQSQQEPAGDRVLGAFAMERDQVVDEAACERVAAQIHARGLGRTGPVPQHATGAPGSGAALVVAHAGRHDVKDARPSGVVLTRHRGAKASGRDQDQLVVGMGVKGDVEGRVGGATMAEGALEARQVDHEILRFGSNSADGVAGGSVVRMPVPSGSADIHPRRPAAPESSMAIPFILDTDPGDDIDDAFAIALACRHPGIDLRAVTTVYGDTVERSRLARAILVAGNRPDIPVAAGCAGGFSVRHPDGLAKLANRAGFNQAGIGLSEAELPPADRRHAADLIIDLVMAGDGDIVVATIGAMTNLAMALVKEPRLRERIPRIVAMAGEFERGFAEWNIRCDPVAAEIVFRSGIPIEVTPWNSGRICTMTTEEVESFCAGGDPLCEVVAECTRRWMATHPNNTPHLYDPVAVAAMLDPTLATWKTGTVTVETNGVATYGYTTFANGEGPHRVQFGVDRARAVAAILAGISAPATSAGARR